MRQFLYAFFIGLGFATALGQPSAAQSQQEVTTVVCSDGNGCRCALSGVNATDMAWLLNRQAPPENAESLILLTTNGVTRWSATTPDDADEEYGGDGVCPIEVFRPAVPEDGTWVGTVRTTSISGCAPQVADMVPGMAANMTFSRQISWNNAFDPRQLSDDPNSNPVTWTKRTPVLFSGKFNSPVASGILQIDGTLSASLVTAEKAITTFWLRIGTDAINAAALSVLGMADCRTTTVYEFKRVGP